MDDLRCIRTVVADPIPALRHGLAALLHRQRAVVQVIDDVATSEEACDACERHQPDLLITDIRIEGYDPDGTFATIRARAPATRIVVFSLDEGETQVCHALGAGAQSYVHKQADAGEIEAAVAATMRGLRYVSPGIAHRLVDLPDRQPLTSRELEILGFLATGSANKRIARAAGIAESTVKFHVNRILGKLACETRTEAVAVALRRGLIRVGPQ